MLKICHAFNFFSIEFAGGTTEFMVRICRAQNEAGLKTVIYAGSYRFDGALADSLQGTEFQILRSYSDRLGFSIMPGLPALARKQLRQFDVVHLHAFRTFQNAVLHHFCRKYGVPFVIDAHGSTPYGKRKPILKRMYDLFWGKRMLRDAAFLIAESDVGIEEYRRLVPGLPESKLKKIPPSFQLENYGALPPAGTARARWNILPGAKIILFVGRLHPIKGLDFLLRGFASLRELRQDCTLVLAGTGDDPDYQKHLRERVERLGLQPCVMFAGFLEEQAKHEALVDADVLVQLSDSEQGPRVPFEAVLCGTPVVVTGHTGSGQAVREFSAGLTVEAGNTRQLVAALQDVLNNPEQARKKTSLAAEKIRKELSSSAMVDKYKTLYQKAAQGHGNHRS